MHRIDHETATSDHKFTEGNPTIPVPATVVTGAWLNAVQEELVAAITGAGLELEKSDNTQLWQAITTAVDNARPGLATTKKPGLVQIGDGLAITPEGLLSVLIASTSQAGLVKPRYGLKIGKDGSLDVDFGDMPTDKFEELLKSIRVPIWLTKNKSFYVNGTTGSDVLDGGRGESADKPFKTIQACASYISNNYNIGSYICTILVSDGEYEESLRLADFSRTTGKILIKSETKFGATLKNPATSLTLIDCTAGVWELTDFSFIMTFSHFDSPFSVFFEVINAEGSGILRIGSFNIESKYTVETSQYARSVRVFRSSNGGQIYILPGTEKKISFSKGNSKEFAVFFMYSKGFISLNGSNVSQEEANIECTGDCTVFCATAGGAMLVETGGVYRPRFLNGASPVTGTRYTAISGGTIDTGRSGTEYFLGDTPGSVETATYSWYK